MSKEQEVLESLKSIIDPDLGRDLVSLGFIKDLSINEEGDVAFTVELTTPASPVKEKFKAQCEKAVSALPWVQNVTVFMSTQKKKDPREAQAPGLQQVATILGVSSCKGGVGKSTVAVNLAYTLAKSGAQVGLFDADVYGPSLPTVVKPKDTDLFQRNDLIQPLEMEGVKLMSFGFVPKRSDQDAAIMRGPMVSQVINQFLTGTDWGALDYLIIDMPPGTGDIQLTLLQLIPMTGAIIVTTPQALSFVDVVKGIQMFDKLKVPTVAVVENMSYFICGQCKTKHYPFGQGAGARLVNQYGFKHAHEIPIQDDLSRSCDLGTPLVLSDPNHPISRCFQEIADDAVREISKVVHGGIKKPTVTFHGERGVILRYPEGHEKTISPAALRRKCRCALCIEEMSGKPLLDPNSVPEDVFPKRITPMGNYAVAIIWSDGHTSSVYPYETLTDDACPPSGRRGEPNGVKKKIESR